MAQFIIKVRDREKPGAALLMTEFARVMTKWDKWQTWIGWFRTPEEAMKQIERQKAQPSRFRQFGWRDYRVFEKNGRKLTLVAEIIEEA